MLPKGTQKKTNTVIIMVDGKEPKTVTTMDSPPEPKKLTKCRLTFILPILLVILLSLLAGYCAWLFFSYESGPPISHEYGNDALFYVMEQPHVAVDDNGDSSDSSNNDATDDSEHIQNTVHIAPDISESVSLTEGDFIFESESAESVYDSSAQENIEYEYWSDELSSDYDYSSDQISISSSSLGYTTHKEDNDLLKTILGNLNRHMDNTYSFSDFSSSIGRIFLKDDGDDADDADFPTFLEDGWNIDDSNQDSEIDTPWSWWDEIDSVQSESSELSEWFGSGYDEIVGDTLSSSSRYPYPEYYFSSSSEGSGEGSDVSFDSFYEGDSFGIEDWLAYTDSYVNRFIPPRPVIPHVPVDSAPQQRIEIEACEWPKKEFDEKATSFASIKMATHIDPETRVTTISTGSVTMTHIFKEKSGSSTSTLIYRDYNSYIFGVKTMDASSSVCYFTSLNPDLSMDHYNDEDNEENEASGSLDESGLRYMTLEVNYPVLLGNAWTWPQIDPMFDAACSSSTKYWAQTILIKE